MGEGRGSGGWRWWCGWSSAVDEQVRDPDGEDQGSKFIIRKDGGEAEGRADRACYCRGGARSSSVGGAEEDDDDDEGKISSHTDLNLVTSPQSVCVCVWIHIFLCLHFHQCLK